jgi:flagellar hook capping protein FlgD
VKRTPTLAFGGLTVATVAAFFIIQHLKVSTPLISNVSAPFPSTINPRSGGRCVARRPDHTLGPVSYSRTSVSFLLLHQSDDVSVYVFNQRGQSVATLAAGVFMAGLPHQMLRTFTWGGRVYGGSLAPAGRYYVRVVLRRQDRTIDITNSKGLLDWVKVEYASRCPTA